MSAPDPILVQILTACLSPDSAVRVPAETTLQSTVAQGHGFTIQLLDIILSPSSVPPQVRALAATCFKNCVSKRWKKSQLNPITPAEKVQARGRCISCVMLPESAIFRVVIAATAKILRADWTADEWPDLLPNVISLASAADSASSRRGMLALHALVKELSSMSLLSEKQKFIAACPQIAAVVVPAWQQILPLISSSAEAAEFARTIAKVYKHTLMRSAALSVPGGPVFAFLESCCQVASFAADICARRTQSAIHEQIFALSRTLLSCLRSFIKALPLQCTPVLPNLAGACVHLLVASGEMHSANDAVASLSCRAIAVLEVMVYENLFKPGSNTRVSVDPAAKQQAEAAFGTFFSDSTVSQLVHLLACDYCSLSPAQLARWEESPEAFSNECDAQVCLWNFTLGPAQCFVFVEAHFYFARATCCLPQEPFASLFNWHTDYRLQVFRLASQFFCYDFLTLSAFGTGVLELVKKVAAVITSCCDGSGAGDMLHPQIQFFYRD